jgi:hypothetical protein
MGLVRVIHQIGWLHAVAHYGDPAVAEQIEFETKV